LHPEQTVPDKTDSLPTHVLLAQADPLHAALLGRLLESRRPGGYVVTRVARLQDALERVAQAQFAAALLDLKLPDFHGRETLSEISNLAPDMPVILLAGREHDEMVPELIRKGAQDVLRKDELDGTWLERAIEHAILRKGVERRLAEAAHFDALTGLPNRTLFNDRLSRAVARARRRGTGLSLLFMDLDRFKEVNDTLGHAAGDALLAQLGQRFSSAVRCNDTVARMGGDEFTVIIEDVKDASIVYLIAEKLLSLFSESFEVAGRRVYVGTSIGIAHAGAGRLEPDTLLNRADAAMYRAKECGGECFWVYEEQPSQAVPGLSGNRPTAARRAWQAWRLPSRAAGGVLLVDDNPDDRRLVAEALKSAGLSHRLRTAKDGKRALTCLLEHGGEPNQPLPSLILLDLDMPGLGGLEVLESIRAAPALQQVPVVVLGAPTSDSDIAGSYARGANAYVAKPEAGDQAVDTLGVLLRYWLNVVQLPPRQAQVSAV
jgi:diguanylate cyclase (GGDEF)-like protein